MQKILILSDYYLPGYLAGGPIKSISNIVDLLENTADITLITRDHDLGSNLPYEIQSMYSLNQMNSNIIYTSSFLELLKTYFYELRSEKYSIVYINSFFSPLYSILPIMIMLLTRKKCEIILAPRGELSKNAIESGKFMPKIWIKRIWIQMFKFLFGKSNITWQASSDNEKKDILGFFDTNSVILAPDICILPNKIERYGEKIAGQLRIIFLGRIVSVKNLLFCLKTLSKLRVKVDFDIFGPIEDVDYWKLCIELQNAMPPWISIRYQGQLDSSFVSDTISKYDLLFSPSLTENYGHVIVEALGAGIPVLISKNTPWRNLSDASAGWDIDLDEDLCARILTEAAEKDESTWHLLRKSARKYIENHPYVVAAIKANRELFHVTGQEVN